jgi:hypothetical protein
LKGNSDCFFFSRVLFFSKEIIKGVQVERRCTVKAVWSSDHTGTAFVMLALHLLCLEKVSDEYRQPLIFEFV